MKIISILLLTFCLSFSVFAAKESKEVIAGKKIYRTTLKDLFKIDGKKFAGTYLQIEWKRMFKQDGKRFIKKYSKKYPGSEKFLKSPEFKKNLPDLAAFANYYAADSGNDLGGCN